MITKNDILKMVHKVAKRASGRQDKKLMHPEREWMLILIVIILLLIIGSFYNARQFIRYSSLEKTLPPTDVSITKYRDTDIPAVLDIFTKREEEFNQLLKTGEVMTVSTASQSDTIPENSQPIDENTLESR